VGHPLSTRLIARTAVVAGFVVVLAVAGRPGWLAALLGLSLVLVWAAPFLLASNRRPVPDPAAPVLPLVEPEEAGPGL
jgi:hypothetical protein